jgi:hypothetical protein
VYIGYDSEKERFYLAYNQDDYMDWIKVDSDCLSDEDKEKIKSADIGETFPCDIQVTLL